MDVTGVITSAWYARRSPIQCLWPLSFLFQNIVTLRRWAYRHNLLSKTRFKVPVIIIGNVTVGGTGKTPLIIAIAEHLLAEGFRPGIVSRGYGAHTHEKTTLVTPLLSANAVGDEALEIIAAVNCPMVIGKSRVDAVQALLDHHDVNVVLSDDGLQHYALDRSLEIGVIDGERRFGNGFCLPAGPCREPTSRWSEVDLRVCQGKPLAHEFAMTLVPVKFVNVSNPTCEVALHAWQGESVEAVTGIGHPQRFFQALSDLNIHYRAHAFRDHHPFTQADFYSFHDKTVLMTAKDAVKCRGFAKKTWWTLKVKAVCDPRFLAAISHHIRHFAIKE